MTKFTVPPDQDGLALKQGDELTVKAGGTATDTTLNGGIEIVRAAEHPPARRSTLVPSSSMARASPLHSTRPVLR